MKPEIRFTRFFSTDSAKAIKADKFGYLNGINYMAQDDTASTAEKYFTLCPHSTAGCRALCLGKYSGQAAMVTDLEHGTNAVRESRVRKAQYFMNDRKAFLAEMTWHIQDLAKKAKRKGKTLAIRPNGSTDINFAGIARRFPETQFIDYTKSLQRVLDKKRPSNYHLTFSLSEENKAEALQALAAGFNVAAVFGHGQPKRYLGHDVIDGTVHDLRHLDPSPRIVGLDPKGAKAKADQSGFVVRNY
jgi:predicted Zn-ribbon and HTH transcriptional regulator